MQKAFVFINNVMELNKEFEAGYKITSTFQLCNGDFLFILEKANG